MTCSLFRTIGDDDVFIKITHCGVCFADITWTRNRLGDSKYPLVPGYVSDFFCNCNRDKYFVLLKLTRVFTLHIRHEIAGIVRNVGSNVHRFKVGDQIGVGTYVNSCQDCEYCNDRLEVHCEKESVYTFNGVDVDGTITKGGYSSFIVVHER